MLGKLLAFELKYHLKSVGFWVAFFILFALGLATVSLDFIMIGTITGERIKANGAQPLATMFLIFSVALILFGAIFVVGGLMRDAQHKMLELVHSSPVSNRDLTITRMIGVVLAAFLCLMGAQFGAFVGQFVPWIDKESLGPVHPSYFLQPALVFTFVNAVLVTSIFALIASVTRNRTLVYVSAVGILVLYLATSMFTDKIDSELITSLSDPLGGAAYGNVTEFWPADEQNTRLMPLWSHIGLNRLLWGGVGLVLYGLSFLMFKRGLVSGKTKDKQDISNMPEAIIAPTPIHLGAASSVSMFFKRVGFEFGRTVKSIPFAILTLIAIALFGLSIAGDMVAGVTPTLPTSSKMVGTVLGSLSLPMMIIIVFFGSELVWRDRAAHMHEILDATPVSNGVLMFAKWVALAALVSILLLVGIGIGMSAQMILGDVPINAATYFKNAFFGFAPMFLMFSALIIFLQNFMPGRIAGMVVGGVVLTFLLLFINMLPFYHPLMGFGRTHLGSYSEINGFSSPTPARWFISYWLGFVGLFAVIGIWLWRRGTDTRLSKRFKSIRSNLHTPALLGLAGALGLIGFCGFNIYKAYNIDGDYMSQKAQEKERVSWEKLMGAHIKDVVPKVRSVKVKLDMQPKQRTAQIKGHLRVENTTGAPLKELYLNLPIEEQDVVKLDIEGGHWAKDIKNFDKIKDYNYRVYKFEPALAEGATFSIDFAFDYPKPGIYKSSPIRNNGTFVNSGQLLPAIGVQDDRLRNPDKRRKYGLPKLEKMPDRDDMKARQINFFDKASDYVDFEAEVCTESGQIPIAPGERIASSEKNGVICNTYKSVRPIANFFSFLSADYVAKRGNWTGSDGTKLPLAIYYHKPHGYNVDLMLGAMKNALTDYTTTFGPYQYSQLRILEFPYASFAQSFASTIPFSENIGFVQKPGDPKDFKKMDLATYVAMHEIGHQWFGHQIMPGQTKGFNVLSEGLTENAALMAYENKLGYKKARRLIENRFSQQYLVSRAMDNKEEPPLALAEEQGYLVYQKAGWVFWGLKHMIGEDKMQGAIRAFLQEYGQKGPPYPTTKQLVDYLLAASPDEYHQLIHDYWDRITLWKMSVGDDVKLKDNGDGTWTVSFTVKMDKRIADEKTGKETSVLELEKKEGLSEWLEIGFYEKGTDPKETLGSDWFKLEKIKITKPETTLSFTLDKKPSALVLDPRRLLIERNVDDNRKKIED